jgi:hypothetical protein
MFFVTDTQTIIDYTDNLKLNPLIQEIIDFPERFMPKENIMITVLPLEKHPIFKESYITGHMTLNNKFVSVAKGSIEEMPIDEETKKRFMAGAATYILESLNNKKTQIYYKDTNFKTKSGRDKIVPVVFIRNSSNQTIYENYIPKDVDWKHSWECVGHWRFVKGIGKDRYGEYNKKGRTWVNPCIKGDGILIKKTRIIQKAEII